MQGSLKNRPADPLHHLVFTVSSASHLYKDTPTVLDSPTAPSYSLFRSHDLEEAEDLCRKALDCKLLFTTLSKLLESIHLHLCHLDPVQDIKKPIQDMLAKMHLNPLYKMIHIAILCTRDDIFTDENVDFMNKNAIPFNK